MASRKVFNQCLVLPILLMNCSVLLVQCGRPHSTEGEDLVTATCKHTLHFQVCNSSLRSVPISGKTSDLRVLAEIALNLSTAYAAETLTCVHELQSNSSAANNIYVSRCLRDCEEEFSEAIENLQHSKEALANGDCDKVDTLISAAMSDAETCEDGFKDLQQIEDYYSTSPLTERNCHFSELCSNALAITKLLV
ncbi:U1 Pectin methylesterase [Vigna angularis]|uniref:U1 Pectin methylesterase n=3 Tax=Phaseolus angularis TaxID=3914 RepID=A0A8T0L632_PHAAN|nr:putative invertase inhibitor [Vigna angularis]KAG2407414.1 U1 Pectin methylesterase [Vigna angularis]BAT76928.1 hypothetical protein VIGAN_01500100 [Vigna angularis var. angularis]